MRIAVTGRSGQVVTSLIERGAVAGHEIVPLGRPELDLGDPDSVHHTIAACAPDLVVSAAAYTAVDKAESEPELAFAVNAQGAGAVARAAAACNAPVIHLSTDYVFDGLLGRPYAEGDPTGPTGVYGASKLAGETAVLDGHPGQATVLRVAWVYSPFGGNFVKTMLRLAADRDEIGVVADQIGNPTSALDIADGVLTVADNLVRRADPGLRGVFHMTAAGEASWAEFAEAIFAASPPLDGPQARVRPIATQDYPTPARRPANSRLDSRLLAQVHGVALPSWRDSMNTVVGRLLRA
ncbi:MULTISPECIES: dTDP-4-dehydrorhamnose reductase [unclassified Novosphingobium]|uniref:dTDP-4-dehydrorhamnose reductase n=1 Tax=unclassified Novosphingobium TaxID=2644732 RepID=UPI00146ED3B6|nr:MULTISPECIES: dTDP-4-dehydrorhamnose reductase [unclassified Novosphingobium]NMN03197.1 dTDP-4-dehydrorhamnose reductase [Novosphingobium sp. SG919]NMN86813.1 dTDP-4-dehydrorhamnose reductase [Novosphingobium sp. SG916]